MAPVDGGYTDWEDVGQCSKSCGGGSQNQSRNCTNPAPANGGLPCSGPKERIVPCNTQPCPPRKLFFINENNFRSCFLNQWSRQIM